MSGELFKFGLLVVTETPGVGREGPAVRVSVAGRHEDLPEGLARRFHLALRGFVREQKRRRGDTPRGRAQLADQAQPQLVNVVGFRGRQG